MAGTDRIIAFIAAFNEQGKIGRSVSSIPREYVDEILVIDDGSTDRTPDEAREAGALVISSAQREGVGSVIRHGLRYAREHGFDIIVFLAGNAKDDGREVIRLTRAVTADGFDFVQGSRYLKGGGYGNMPLYRQVATRLVHPLLFSLVTGKKITDSTNGFRAFRLSLLDDPSINIDQEWLDKYELEPYLFYKAIKLGYKVTEVPVTKIYPDKKIGYTKMKPLTGWWSILRPLVYLALGIKS